MCAARKSSRIRECGDATKWKQIEKVQINGVSDALDQPQIQATLAVLNGATVPAKQSYELTSRLCVLWVS
jgi:hypothetical protein